jgi:hypothetical protein
MQQPVPFITQVDSNARDHFMDIGRLMPACTQGSHDRLLLVRPAAQFQTLINSPTVS